MSEGMTQEEYSDATRQLVLQVAFSHLGTVDPTEYWEECLVKDTPPFPKHWCGVAAMTWLKRAGLIPDVKWKLRYGFVEVAPNVLPRTDLPQPGDVAYFHTPYQHYALVVGFRPDGKIELIQGNSRDPAHPKEPPHVRTSTHDRSEVSWFYDIEPYIARAHHASFGGG